MDLIAIPFGYVMRFCAWVCFNNYTLALLLFAFVVKLVLLPFGIKQQSAQIKSARLRPKIAAIEKKYAGRTDRPTLQKKQQEIMELQQREGVSMFGGCLPLLIQFPILIGLYGVIRNPLTHLLGYGSSTLKELSAIFGTTDEIALIKSMRADSTLVSHMSGVNVDKLPDLTLFGMDLTAAPSETFNWLIIIPIAAAVLSYLTMVISRKLNNVQMTATGDAQKSNFIMNAIMPLISGYISYIYPATLGMYWAYQSLFGILQTVILAKVMPLPKFSEDDMKRAEKEMKVDEELKKPVKIRSLHHIDDDEDEAVEQASAVSSRYGDEDEDDRSTPVPSSITPAPIKKDTRKHNKKSAKGTEETAVEQKKAAQDTSDQDIQ